MPARRSPCGHVPGFALHPERGLWLNGAIRLSLRGRLLPFAPKKDLLRRRDTHTPNASGRSVDSTRRNVSWPGMPLPVRPSGAQGGVRGGLRGLQEVHGARGGVRRHRDGEDGKGDRQNQGRGRQDEEGPRRKRPGGLTPAAKLKTGTSQIVAGHRFFNASALSSPHAPGMNTRAGNWKTRRP